jgi:DNA repair exonuclease SbcCD ATPase subunit
LILDEPTNDLDTDMLAAIEDLLDGWPGTLIVVSHDRYLLERVADSQYALLGDGSLRHLPGGIDQYLELRRASIRTGNSPVPSAVAESSAAKASDAASKTSLSGADLRAAEKNLSRIERALAKLTDELLELDERLVAHQPTDYEGLAELAKQRDEIEAKRSSLELEWLETSELLQP